MSKMKRLLVCVGVLTASFLSLTMLCTVMPEISYAAEPAESVKEESVSTKKDMEQKGGEIGGTARKEIDGTNEIAEKKGEAIDSTGEREWDEIDFTEAIDITEDSVQLVNIETAGDYQVFRFVPTETKEYTFFSEGSYDTSGMIGTGESYRYNDDRDDDTNFSITSELTAGQTYYCVAQMLSYSKTGSFLCMISSTRQTYQLETSDIERFEILQPAKDTWYESDNTTIWPHEAPMYGLKYRITCKNGTVIESALESYSGNSADIYGIVLSGAFKFLKTNENGIQLVDTDRDDNAIIYSIGDDENEQAFSVEVPVTFHASSPVASIAVNQNPWEDLTVSLSNAYSVINNREGLVFTVTYTDGTTKTVHVNEDDSGTSIEDGYNERVQYSWKNLDDNGNPTEGANAIVISYIGADAEIPVTVVDNSVRSIQIVRNPSKMSYEIFDRWPDLYGMQLRITFNNGTAVTVTVEEHDSEPRIWDGFAYGYLDSWFTTTNNRKYVAVEYRDCMAYYYPAFQTYASMIKNAVALLPGRAVSVSLNANARYRIFRFVPLDTKEYVISSAGDSDTYVELLDAGGNILASDDDGYEDDHNFKLAYNLQAGKTYYYVVRMYNTTKEGSFTVTLGGASSYTITYNLNGGTNHASNPAAYYSETVNLQNPSRAKYAFAGWYTDSACKNKLTQIPGNARRNYVLYAKWQKVKAPGKANLTSASNSKAKKISVKYKKVKKVDGYEISYSTNKKFKKASSVTAKKTKATIGQLKKGKTYYIRVCAYKLDSTGQKIRGKWSSAKKVTVKK